MLDDGNLGATRYRFVLILVLYKHYRQFYERKSKIIRTFAITHH